MSLEAPPRLVMEPAVRRALEEDLGRAGDITTMATVPADARASAHLRARSEGRIAGVAAALIAFDLVDADLKTTVRTPDGHDAAAGDDIVTVEGSARSILTAERVALNFLGHLSGIATETRAIAASIAHTDAKVTCTRKTTPGLRVFEKFAVRCGGGVNHRFGLDDGILIKDNHIAAAGGIAAAVEGARAQAGHMVRVELEVDTLAQLEEALALGVDAVLLDNMSLDDLLKAVAMTDGRATLEASGGITPETAPAIAETGVDLLSVGWITHSAPSLDVGLDLEPL